MSDGRRLVDKLWSYCNVLRDDGVSTIEYTEQLTFLLFLKMANERETRSLNPERIVPTHCSWQRLSEPQHAGQQCLQSDLAAAGPTPSPNADPGHEGARGACWRDPRSE